MTIEDDLELLVEVVEEFATESATVTGVRWVADGRGGGLEETVTSGPYRCWISPIGNSSSEQVIAGRFQDRAAYTITLLDDPDVTTSDRIVVGSRTFEVVGLAPHGTVSIRRKVYCLEVT